MNITIIDTGYVGLVTGANVDDLVERLYYKPVTTVKDGIQRFVDWYLEFYGQ
jgi:UDP-glucuronate 4-epimerase